eukprot:scaffold252192_cov21-Prasinocladus_malaysianus.AAC.1
MLYPQMSNSSTTTLQCCSPSRCVSIFVFSGYTIWHIRGHMSDTSSGIVRRGSGLRKYEHAMYLL